MRLAPAIVDSMLPSVLGSSVMAALNDNVHVHMPLLVTDSVVDALMAGATSGFRKLLIF